MQEKANVRCKTYWSILCFIKKQEDITEKFAIKEIDTLAAQKSVSVIIRERNF